MRLPIKTTSCAWQVTAVHSKTVAETNMTVGEHLGKTLQAQTNSEDQPGERVLLGNS